MTPMLDSNFTKVKTIYIFFLLIILSLLTPHKNRAYSTQERFLNGIHPSELICMLMLQDTEPSGYLMNAI